ncbi:MAG: MltA domain-containing protein [Acidobacteriota bacterium]
MTSNEIRSSQGDPIRVWRVLCAVLAVWCLSATGWILVRSFGPDDGSTQDAGVPVPLEALPEEPVRVLRPATFDDLPGWDDDDHAGALAAFLETCRAWVQRDDTAPVGPDGMAGTYADWRYACFHGETAPNPQYFFQSEFRPWQVLDGDESAGLFTGYFEPTLRGSRQRGAKFQHPLYRRPPELVAVDLGRFRADLRGRRLAGRVEGGQLLPFDDRAALAAGSLAGRGLELVWVDDSIDSFFLHIQGSGRVELAEGGVMRVGYAAQNGHTYRAIGRSLIERRELTREEVSLQSIRRWLRQHPQEAPALMAENASYVFFRELSEPGPVGSLGVVLTPGRSLAVDRTYMPLGAPVWLDATAPAAELAMPDRALRRLMVAQDTGGAIRGPVRGDVFWGPGEEAAEVAGRMKHSGRYWLLLPKEVEPPLGPEPVMDSP